MEYKSLIFTLAKRDLRVQYAQTFMGILWSAIQPLAGLVIFWFVFEKVFGGVDTGDVPYPLYVFSGLIAWYYFTFIMGHAGASLINSQMLIKKVYFPRLVAPLSKVLVGSVEFMIALTIMLLIMIIFGKIPTYTLLALPIFVLINIITGLSLGIWLSALTIRYRDLQHIIPYIVNYGMFLTPVFYPGNILPKQLIFANYFNPMAGSIALFRWILFDGPLPSVNYLAGFILAGLLLISGVFYFKKIEKRIAEYV